LNDALSSDVERAESPARYCVAAASRFVSILFEKLNRLSAAKLIAGLRVFGEAHTKSMPSFAREHRHQIQILSPTAMSYFF
jgi:hypothetical protein